MVDISVKSGAAWVCHAPGRHLADVLLPVNISNKDNDEEDLSQSEGDETHRYEAFSSNNISLYVDSLCKCLHGSADHSISLRGEPVLLEQTEEGSPCVLMLHCSSASPAAISRLLVVSEARTMEVYSQTGEYCGTVRGERDDNVQPDGYIYIFTRTQLPSLGLHVIYNKEAFSSIHFASVVFHHKITEQK